MKSAKTMASLAKALAIDHGIRGLYGGDKILGFGIELDELRRLYAREGFPVQKSNSTVIEDHIATWDLGEIATKRGNMVFFNIDQMAMEDQDALKQLAACNLDFNREFVGFDSNLIKLIRGESVDKVA